MSAAARGAAGYLCASGKLLASPHQKAVRAAERAAEELKRDRLIRVLADQRLIPATQALLRESEVIPKFNRGKRRKETS